VKDLIDLLGVVPFNELVHPEIMRLNPTFGSSSLLVGGADTDLIAGDTLIDFKTTIKNEIDGSAWDQLFGYWLLAQKQHSIDPTFPVINRVAFYFCRHGYLWPLDTSFWTSRFDFPEMEDWFFKRAEERMKQMEENRKRLLESMKIGLPTVT